MQKTRIVGTQGKGARELEQHVHPFETATGKHVGSVVLQERFLNFSQEVHPFLSDTFGTAMNQAITFGGTPEIIHNGGTSAEWDGTATQGTWNFADGGKVSITSADDNDAASFAEEGATTIDMSGFTALTGEIDLDTYNPTNNSIIVQFDLAGVPVGNSIDLNNFIDTGDFSAQNFVIPKAELGLTTQLLDGMTLTITRTGGTKPTIKFDDIQFENTGDPAVFKVTTPTGTRFHVAELRIRIEDDIASTLSDATLHGLDPTTLLGVAALGNGINIASVRRGKTSFAATIKDLGDFLATGSNIVNAIALNTKTLVTLSVEFREPIVLLGEEDSFISFTINDDLSALTAFTASARGAREI